MDLGTLDANGDAFLLTPSYGDRNFYDATSTTAAQGSMGIETIQGAVISIDGNSLPQAPEESFNLAHTIMRWAMTLTLIPYC